MSIADEYADLDDALAPEEDYDQPPSDPGDIEGVNRALRRLARHTRERANVLDVADAEVARIRAWAEGRCEIHDKAITWESEGLEMYHRARLRDDPTLKTISLPYGTLKAAGGEREYAWTYDDEALIRWARASAPDLVETVYKVGKTELKKALFKPAIEEGETAPAIDSDGDAVPGVTVTRRGPQFSINLGDDL